MTHARPSGRGHGKRANPPGAVTDRGRGCRRPDALRQQASAARGGLGLPRCWPGAGPGRGHSPAASIGWDSADVGQRGGRRRAWRVWGAFPRHRACLRLEGGAAPWKESLSSPGARGGGTSRWAEGCRPGERGSVPRDADAHAAPGMNGLLSRDRGLLFTGFFFSWILVYLFS